MESEQQELMLPLRLLKEIELRSRISIVSREFLHLMLIWRFFTTYKSDQANQQNKSSELREAVTKITPIMQKLKESILKVRENYNINDQENINKAVYQRYVKINKELKTILIILSSVQKKLRYTLESFPPYYPSPNIFRARQELKAYQFLEDLGKAYLQVFKKLFRETESVKIKVSAYWETNPENVFFPELEGHFLFEGSYYMVNQPSLWIILAHEALHFLIPLSLKSKSFNDKAQSIDLGEFLQSVVTALEDTRLLMGLTWDSSMLGQVVFQDVLCDCLLCKLLGIPYYCALWRLLFSFDEAQNGLYYPQHRQWWIRLRTAIEFLEDKKGVNGLDISEFKKVLEAIHNFMLESSLHLGDTELFCYEERCIVKIFTQYVKHFIKKKQRGLDEIRDKIDKNKLFKLLKLEEAKTEFLLGRILAKLKKEEISLNEGRVNVLVYKDYKDGKNDAEALERYAKNLVVLTSFLKVRFDGYEQEFNLKKLLDILQTETPKQDAYTFFHLGHYNVVIIDPDFHDKYADVDSEKNEEYKGLLEILFAGSSGTKTDKGFKNSQFIWTPLVKNGVLFYKEDLAGSVIDIWSKKEGRLSISKRQINKFFSSAQKTILLILQLKLKSNEKWDDVINEIQGKLPEDSEIMITYSFAWCDWIVFIKLGKLEGDYSKDIVRIKQYLLEKSDIFMRTKTDILAGLDTVNSSQVLIPSPEIVVRLSAETQNTEKNNQEDAEKNNAEILEGWNAYMRPGIYDIILKKGKEQEKKAISMQELYETILKLTDGQLKLQKNKLASDIQIRFSFPYKK